MRKWVIGDTQYKVFGKNNSNTNNFLDIAISYIRKGLFATSLSGLESIQEFFKPKHLGGYCILAQTITSIYLEELGVNQKELILLEMGDDFGSKQVHAFVIVKMPNDQFYIIDPTFAQFFYDEDASTTIGKKLISLGATDLAIDLCYKGYSLINDSIFKKYLAAFPISPSERKDIKLDKLYYHSNSQRQLNRSLFGDELPKIPHLKQLKFKILNN